MRKRNLSILMACEWDYAGVGFQLSQAINMYTPHKSAHVRWAGSTLRYPAELDKPGQDRLRQLWLAADVIHIHDAFNHFPAGLPARPTVITWHGSKYRRSPGTNNNLAAANSWLQTVSTIDLLPLGANLWFPDCRELQPPPY